MPSCHALLRTRLRTIRVRANGTAAAVATVSQVATAALTASTAARVLDVGVSAGEPSLLTPAPDHRSRTVIMFVGESWLGGIVVGDRRGNGVASLGLLGVELLVGVMDRGADGASDGHRQQGHKTVDTRTSASTQSLVRTSGLRPNSTRDHFGKRATKKVSITASWANEWAFIESPFGQWTLGSAVSLGRVRRRVRRSFMASSSVVTWAVRPPAGALVLSKLVQRPADSTALCCPWSSSTESGHVRIRQSTLLITIRLTGSIPMAVEEHLTRPWRRH